MSLPSTTGTPSTEPAAGRARVRGERFRGLSLALSPGLPAVGLMIIWAAHDGGYDQDTWYWGALAFLGLLAGAVLGLGGRRRRLSRASVIALTLFTLYVAWSYASIAWAEYPGAALDGSNRALLYLCVFALMTVLPWTVRAAELALSSFAIGIGTIAAVVMFRLATGDHVSSMIVEGRLATPTGYFNSTAALFTLDALLSIGLAARRSLPSPLRGLLMALAAISLQLAVVVQSRGWLFTLPLVALLFALVARDRLALFAATLVPVLAALIPIRSLLRIFNASSSSAASLQHSATHAGRLALGLAAGAFVIGTIWAMIDRLGRLPSLSPPRRRIAGTLVVLLILAGVAAGGVSRTHGHPFAFISRQWRGFSHPQVDFSSRSHFSDVGSGRYDFWRVSLEAFRSHPVAGLGQDNFLDYYLPRRRTREEPEWNHSLEMRLLSMTGVVGFALFAGFIAAAVAAAMKVRRADGEAPATPSARGWAAAGPRPLARRAIPADAGQLAAVALAPLIVWLVHGSVDWFWEMPAISGPALGFLGLAGALAPAPGSVASTRTSARAPVPARGPGAQTRSGPALPRPLGAAAGTIAFLAALTVLAFSYLSVREVSVGNEIGTSNPPQAFRDLKLAADLNPLSADPGRYAGAIALEAGDFYTARQRFGQSIQRDPGGWFAWLGAGLAASALGDANGASRDFREAKRINSVQPAIRAALARVRTRHPLTTDEAFRMLVVVG